MAERLQAVKGMNDVFAPDIAKWHFIEQRARALFERSARPRTSSRRRCTPSRIAMDGR
jgi:hypothetical protein